MLEARRCPICGETYSPMTRSCPKDGAELHVIQSLIGKVLDDRYRIESLLGTGGMGAVYRATHIHLESAFAVKVLHPEMIAYEGAIERFRREAKAARRIHHPNAIEVTDFGVTEEKLVYLVMEIVEGRLLRDLIYEGVFDYRRAVDILCQTCAAIQAAHDNGVIHRDLKPDNIIVRRIGNEESVKVLDFGIAKLLESNQTAESQEQALTKRGMLIGTPQYMSPEQCQGRELEPPSDLYSLGIIGYEMLSGRTPFDSATQLGFIAKHLRETPPPLRSVAMLVPESVERVIMKTLEKESGDRQRSATQLANELRLAVQEAEARQQDLSGRDTLVEVPRSDKATAVILPAAETLKHASPRTPPGPTRTQDRRADEPTQPEFSPAVPAKSRLPMIGLVAVLVAASAIVAYFVTRDPVDRNLATPSPTATPVGNLGEMALIRGGAFVMGSDEGDADERPEHEVTVNDFYLDKTEVTNEQYKKCVDAKHCPAPLHWMNGSFAQETALLPVTHVTWAAAAAFARFAGKRLPAEAEWEYAARGGTANNFYPWGSRWEKNAANVARENSRTLAPVGSFKKDQVFGVFDLAGNVSEWVEDDYTTYVKREPIDGCKGCKVYRGGNFIDEIKDSKASKRWAVFADVPSPYDKVVLPRVGFRCAKDAR